mmetsp:Transcript_90507/g.258537  ORF Transcript_90507/g.258537 Transcript_90507/m.258537 type:complete len:92 (+) Transcript_90507:536-811(+)
MAHSVTHLCAQYQVNAKTKKRRSIRRLSTDDGGDGRRLPKEKATVHGLPARKKKLARGQHTSMDARHVAWLESEVRWIEFDLKSAPLGSNA